MQALADHRWFDPRSAYEKTIHFNIGSTGWMVLSRSGIPDTFVKISEFPGALADEALRYAAASATYGSLTPHLKGYRQLPQGDILVSQAVDADGLSPLAFQGGRHAAQVMSGLDRYFAAMARSELPASLPTLTNSVLIPTLREYYAAHPQSVLIQRHLSDVMHCHCLALPNLPQHGDLVLNNLALAQGELIVFDWEDFGRIQLPGLDLYTVLMSLGLGGPEVRAHSAKANSVWRRLVQGGCPPLNISIDQLGAMKGVYLLAFRYLKRNYGPDIGQRMDRLIAEYAPTWDWAPAPSGA